MRTEVAAADVAAETPTTHTQFVAHSSVPHKVRACCRVWHGVRAPHSCPARGSRSVAGVSHAIHASKLVSRMQFVPGSQAAQAIYPPQRCPSHGLHPVAGRCTQFAPSSRPSLTVRASQPFPSRGSCPGVVSHAICASPPCPPRDLPPHSRIPHLIQAPQMVSRTRFALRSCISHAPRAPLPCLASGSGLAALFRTWLESRR